MEWDHLRWQLSHRFEYGPSFDVTTTLYRNSFSRAWRKLNGFRGAGDLAAILTSPDAGNNPIFYDILTGQSDTTSPAEELLLGTNDRRFVSQGIQSSIHSKRELWPGKHEITAGLRLHHDQAERLHSEDAYAMASGSLMAVAPTVVTNDSLAQARAAAAFAQDKVEVGPVVITAGSRVEMVVNELEDRMLGDSKRETYGVWIPGAGAYYRATEWMGLLAGVHKGFVPVAPGADAGIKPEESINYEAGFRLSRWGVAAEAIGFFSDYQNLKGTCTVSSGCQTEQVGDEFNGGAVHTLGLESLVQASPKLTTELQLVLRASYTFTRSSFETSFTSSNPQWGDVVRGDRQPYLPEHQLSATTGIRTASWEITGAVRAQSTMRNSAGSGGIEELDRIPGYAVVDIAGSVAMGNWGRAYLTFDNVLDDRYLVSYRPFGARPGKPRFVILGYKNGF